MSEQWSASSFAIGIILGAVIMLLVWGVLGGAHDNIADRHVERLEQRIQAVDQRLTAHIDRALR